MRKPAIGEEEWRAHEELFLRLRFALEDEEDDEFLATLHEVPAVAQWCDPDGLTLLHLAARNGRTRAVMELVRLGSNPSRRDAKRRTPLHDAVIKFEYSVPSLVFLLGAGSDIDARNGYGQTPLMLACNYSNYNAVSVLLAGGAKDRFRSRRGDSARDLIHATLDSAKQNPRKYRRQILECGIVLELLGVADGNH